MTKVRVLVLRAPGANCDQETEFAFATLGGQTERIHINRVREAPGLLKDFQILVVPGGFTYGDDIAAGRILASQLTSSLADSLHQFRDAGKLILGICNGFQVLIKTGLLAPADADGSIPATLTNNTQGRFEDRWITMKASPGRCPFLAGYDLLEAPIAHGEGRFVCRNSAEFDRLETSGQIVLRYVNGNPNGSMGDTAGLCDPTGRVLGLMPHPERHIFPTQHPQWTRRARSQVEGDGVQLFRNAINFFR